MFPVVTNLALAYCICAAPSLAKETLPGVAQRPALWRSATASGAPDTGDQMSDALRFAALGIVTDLLGFNVLRPTWLAPRLAFFPWLDESRSLAPWTYLFDDGSSSLRPELSIDGCACEEPSLRHSRLTLDFVSPPQFAMLSPDGEVPPRLTIIDGERAARELNRAWKKTVGTMPSDDTILILAAHWAHETNGGTAMFNYNFGGLKGRGTSGLSCLRAAHEGWGWHTQSSLDRFRAYLSAGEGAEDYVSLLVRKYPAAIEAAGDGDILQFVRALREGRYFTGSETAYAQSLVELSERGQRSGYNALRLRNNSSATPTNRSSRTAPR